MAGGAMRALVVAADAYGSPDQSWLPEPMGRTLSSVAAASFNILDSQLREAVDAANLWAGQTGSFSCLPPGVMPEAKHLIN